eukprot:scaffold130259_cov22-Tisochrysis_lutea.AAC.2
MKISSVRRRESPAGTSPTESVASLKPPPSLLSPPPPLPSLSSPPGCVLPQPSEGRREGAP